MSALGGFNPPGGYDAGAEDGSPFMEIWGKVQASLDGIQARQAKMAKDFTPPQITERADRIAGVYPSAGGAMLAVNMGGPDMGLRWHMRHLTVGGQTPITAAAGRGDVFVGPMPVLPAQTTTDSPGKPGTISGSGFANGCMSFWRDQAPALPLSSFYGKGELVVRSGESLWLVISSGTARQVYVVGWEVDEFAEGPYSIVAQT